MRYINYIILLCLIGLSSFVDTLGADNTNTSTVKGYVYDAKSGEALLITVYTGCASTV